MNHGREHLQVNIFKCVESFLRYLLSNLNMGDFHILQGRLEPPSLIKIDSLDLKPSVVPPEHCNCSLMIGFSEGGLSPLDLKESASTMSKK